MPQGDGIKKCQSSPYCLVISLLAKIWIYVGGNKDTGVYISRVDQLFIL